MGSEGQILRAGLRSLTLRKKTQPEGHTALRTSSYGAVVIGLLLAAAAEVTAVHVGLRYFLGEGYQALHIGLGFLHAYMVLWLIGDWRLLRESAHRIEGVRLHISLGVRWRGNIPIGDIRAIQVGDIDNPDVLAGEKRPPHVIAVTPIDAPNLGLELSAPTTLHTYFGLKRTGTELHLYLDDPESFATALRAARAGASAGSGSGSGSGQ